jgi:nitroreductase
MRINTIKMFSVGLKGDPTLIIAICERVSEPLNLLDVGMAAQNIILEAVEIGLGSCAIASFSEDPVKKILGVPDEIRLVLLLSMGYPDEDPKPRPKKSLREIASSERFGEK